MSAPEGISEARSRLSEALESYVDLAVPAGISETLEAYAYLALREAQPETAAYLVGAASALRAKVGYHRMTRPRLHASNLKEIRAAMAESAYQRAWSAGAAHSEAEATSQALLGFVPAKS